MNPKDKENLYRLFRYHANVIGAARMTVLCLNAIIAALKDLRCESEDIMSLYQELADVVKHSEPKIIPLIHLLEEFEKEVASLAATQADEKLRNTMVRVLSEKIALYEYKAGAVTRHGLKHVENGDSIIVHSASSVVTNILVQASRVKRRRYKVIVLQLDPVRTPQVARALKEADIEHTVVPEYNLSHHLDEANKIFIGALTVTKDKKVVAPVGTANVLGLCHVNKIKSYLFANSLHYSHGLAISQQIHKEKTDMVQANSSYCLTTYSHDLLDLNLIGTVINENGVVPPVSSEG